MLYIWHISNMFMNVPFLAKFRIFIVLFMGRKNVMYPECDGHISNYFCCSLWPECFL
jgi:hypothetical protein